MYAIRAEHEDTSYQWTESRVKGGKRLYQVLRTAFTEAKESVSIEVVKTDEGGSTKQWLEDEEEEWREEGEEADQQKEKEKGDKKHSIGTRVPKAFDHRHRPGRALYDGTVSFRGKCGCLSGIRTRARQGARGRRGPVCSFGQVLRCLLVAVGMVSHMINKKQVICSQVLDMQYHTVTTQLTVLFFCRIFQRACAVETGDGSPTRNEVRNEAVSGFQLVCYSTIKHSGNNGLNLSAVPFFPEYCGHMSFVNDTNRSTGRVQQSFARLFGQVVWLF